MLTNVSKDDYSLIVAEALCKKGIDEKTIHIDQKDFAIRQKDDRGRIVASFNLANSYASYNNSETVEQKSEVVERLLRPLFEPVNIKPFQALKDMIFPVFRERRFYPIQPTAKITVGYPQIVVGNHLTTLLAIDENDYIFPITDAQFKEWGVSWDDAFEVAYDNMQKRPPITWQVDEDEERPEDCIYILESDDIYGSSNLIFPSIIAELKVLGTPTVFIPAKNTIIVTGSDNVYGLKRALEIIAECEDREDYLCPEMLSLDEDNNYFPSELAPEHALFEEFNKLRITNNLHVYTSFLDEFEAGFDQVVNHKKIVPYEVFDVDGCYYEEVHIKTGEAPVLMPFAETIVVETSNGKISVPSSKFAQIVGESLTLISEYPLLYELTAPLSDDSF